MIILEDVVCGASELYSIIQRSVSVIQPAVADIHEVQNILKHLWNISYIIICSSESVIETAFFKKQL